MIGRDWREYIVTDDPKMDAHLWAKLRARSEDGGLGSHGLAEYALSLGLRPPGYEEGQYHTIIAHGSATEPARLVWAVGLDYEEQADDDGDDESNALWDAALGVSERGDD